MQPSDAPQQLAGPANRPWWRGRTGRYLLPFGAILTCLLLQGALQLVIPKTTDFPYALFYLVAVFAVAWVGGYGPGVVTCALVMIALPAAAAHAYHFSNLDLSRLALVIAISLLISKVASIQRRIQDKLRVANDELDQRVKFRTEDLAQTVEALKEEVVQRTSTEHRLQVQLSRLHLLDQITRAIGEKQELASVFEVALHSLEELLPIDFGCVCLYDPVASHLTVTSVGARSRPLARQLEMLDDAVIPIDQNGLFRCVGGQLVYEPDTSEAAFPFPQRLHRGRLGCFVAAPLLVESQVFGILLAARYPTQAFSSTDCEFLRQLSEHVGLAAHQAQIHSALQQAYDDLRLSQQTVMQQERLRALGQMASGIAHDINNALSPVALYTEMLLEREPNLSARTREYLATTQRAVGDVTQTVARMREFHRKQEPQLVLLPVDLNLMVQQTIDLTRVRWSDMPQRRGVVVELNLDLAPELPAVAGVEGEIRDALTNLVFNAVDSMALGGVLTIRTRSHAVGSDVGTVSVEVSDTGIGMDEETRRRCLEPFFTTKGERGTGLGLAMVYGVTQRHKGQIELESAFGQGTTVRLNFPARSETAGSVGSVAGASSLTRRLRLLVVDDDPLLIKSLRDSLEADGHIVTVAHGGQDGIDKFIEASKGAEPFDLVITDLGMPHVDGSKVATAVKAASRVTPVILLTGWGQRLTAEGTVPPSVDRVLNKPPRLGELRSALGELTAEAPPRAASLS